LSPVSYKNHLYENGDNLRAATYQLSGPGRSRQLVVYDPRRIPDCRLWLEERLGPLAHFAEAGQERAAESRKTIERARRVTAPHPDLSNVVACPGRREVPVEKLPPEIADYRFGTMPPAVIALIREWRQAAGLSQEARSC
jgi:hypothetical protein